MCMFCKLKRKQNKNIKNSLKRNENNVMLKKRKSKLLIKFKPSKAQGFM